MKYRLTLLAERDVAAILRKTRKQFGSGQVRRYANVIERGVAMVAAEPMRPSSMERAEMGKGVRSFHLELAAKRRHGASHILYFLETSGPHGERELVILRVLHESMEPKRRLIAALRDEG